jgi:hypothetical protein
VASASVPGPLLAVSGDTRMGIAWPAHKLETERAQRRPSNVLRSHTAAEAINPKNAITTYTKICIT